MALSSAPQSGPVLQRPGYSGNALPLTVGNAAQTTTSGAKVLGQGFIDRDGNVCCFIQLLNTGGSNSLDYTVATYLDPTAPALSGALTGTVTHGNFAQIILDASYPGRFVQVFVQDTTPGSHTTATGLYLQRNY